MKVLAKAHPNKKYIYHNNLDKLYLEARLENNKVSFVEVSTTVPIKEHLLKEETVLSLFPVDVEETSRPFLIQENLDFYAILHRDKPRYQKRFIELKTGNSNGTLSRTSPSLGRLSHR